MFERRAPSLKSHCGYNIPDPYVFIIYLSLPFFSCTEVGKRLLKYIL